MTPSFFNGLIVVAGGLVYGFLMPVSARAAACTALLAGFLACLAAGVRAWASFISPTLMDAVLLTDRAGFEAQPIGAAYVCLIGLMILTIRRIFKSAT
jgi:nitrate reductase gamma subunit